MDVTHLEIEVRQLLGRVALRIADQVVDVTRH